MNYRSLLSFRNISILFTSLSFIHCSSTKPHHTWGEEGTLSPGWERVGESASNAALQAETWAPLATAIVLAITGADHKIQNWASDNTPIFGSVSHARDASDNLLKLSSWIYLTSVIITPSGNPIPTSLLNKTKGVAVGFGAMFSTQLLTAELKTLTGRVRPDSSDSRGFPSGHTSAVATNTILTSRNIEYMGLTPWAENSLKIGLNTMTLATAWARVEGMAHYPSDVLFGAALGNFIGAFINDTFLGRYSENITLKTSFSKNKSSLQLYIRF
jgi:membrane-associated phospholipid phosphatase